MAEDNNGGEGEQAPTPEELTALKEKVSKLEELERTKAELEGKVKEYEEDAQTMNWRKAREKEKRLLAALKADGKEVDDDGNLIEKPKGYTEEELEKKTAAQVEKVLLDKQLAKAEKKLAEADRPVFRKAYEKVTHGEEVNSDNVEDFIEQAMTYAGSSKTLSAADRGTMTRGGAPVFEETGKNFADSPEGQALASKIGLKTASSKK